MTAALLALVALGIPFLVVGLVGGRLGGVVVTENLSARARVLLSVIGAIIVAGALAGLALTSRAADPDDRGIAPEAVESPAPAPLPATVEPLQAPDQTPEQIPTTAGPGAKPRQDVPCEIQTSGKNSPAFCNSSVGPVTIEEH